MKNLYKYIKEEITSTPGNTIGMGNPMPPVGDALGSEPVIPLKKKKRYTKTHK